MDDKRACGFWVINKRLNPICYVTDVLMLAIPQNLQYNFQLLKWSLTRNLRGSVDALFFAIRGRDKQGLAILWNAHGATEPGKLTVEEHSIKHLLRHAGKVEVKVIQVDRMTAPTDNHDITGQYDPSIHKNGPYSQYPRLRG